MKKTGNGIGESASNTAVVEQTKPVSHTHPTPAMEAGLREKLERLVAGYQHDPFSCLGLHPEKNGWVIRVWRPDAVTVKLVTARGEEPMARIHEAGIFEWRSGEISGATTSAGQPERPWALRVDEYLEVDAYAFTPQTSDEFLHLFSEGRQLQGYRTFGAHHEVCMGIAGVRFRVWAPNAERVSVVGDFNQWDGRRHGMVSLGLSGVWEIFVPGARAGQTYKYEIRSRISGAMFLRLDPFAREAEVRPSTASRIPQPSQHAWQDEAWIEQRSRWDWQHAPVNIYEVHAGSWMRHPDGRFYSYRDMAERLVPYVVEHGFTHIEFMPLTEHPLDESWGYQTTGYFAPTSRFGSPDDLKYLIDTCHQAGIGVLLDWVPGHFPQDEGALAYFDGSALYEHEDPRLGKQPDWGTHVFNFGRHEVRGFLLSSAHWWLSEFHFDGLRVDAVASMLYLDYSRKEGEWLPNRYGGKENLDAIDFLRELNVMVHGEFPGALTIAEESTAWPLVSRPTYLGGLGFSFKWNMGWMNDTLDYLRHDPVYRRYHHDRLTFGQLYAYSENYVLPLSHDEVVHGKGSLYGKMPGDNWQRLANARLLLAYQMTSPGKKLGFMGNELAGPREWNCSWELDWWLLEDPQHRGVQRLVRDLNHLYRDVPALHDLDCEGTGFSWIDCHDADHSVISWLRRARDGSFVVVVMNCTPVPRLGYRLGVPEAGYYRERINTDSEYYCGSNIGNGEGLYAEPLPWMGYPASVVLTLPPLSMVALVKG